MSVLIKDMKMPKCCLECPFEDSPEFDSYCIAIGNEFIGKWEGLGVYKPDWCPLEEPKTGEWLPIIEANEVGESYPVGIYCSECGETLVCEANFCPNCGARMLGEDGEA